VNLKEPPFVCISVAYLWHWCVVFVATNYRRPLQPKTCGGVGGDAIVFAPIGRWTDFVCNNRMSVVLHLRRRTRWGSLQRSSVFENTYLSFFSDFKKNHDFLRFFEMTYQKVVKSHQKEFSPQYVTKE